MIYRVMRIATIFLLLSACLPACAQQPSIIALDSGKAAFKREEYSAAIKQLTEAVSLDPKNPEAYYFLGYAYSRLNSSDAKGMIGMKLSLVKKSSEAFEKVNTIASKYAGEQVILGPYSKIASEWGSMAVNYWYQDKPDSLAWALKEGKKRGGFSDIHLAVATELLKSCSKNAILVTYGDDFFFPLFYVQQIENVRPDVTTVDVGLLNTTWYPSLLVKKTALRFDMAKPLLDTIEYCAWKDSIVKIPISGTQRTLSWKVKPSYQNGYLLRGDRVLLSLLKANQFARDIYFTPAFSSESQLGLDRYFRSLAFLDLVNTTIGAQPYNYEVEIVRFMRHLRQVNENDPENISMARYILSDIFGRLDPYFQASDKTNSHKLLKLIDIYLPPDKPSILSPELKEYLNTVRKFCSSN